MVIQNLVFSRVASILFTYMVDMVDMVDKLLLHR